MEAQPVVNPAPAAAPAVTPVPAPAAPALSAAPAPAAPAVAQGAAPAASVAKDGQLTTTQEQPAGGAETSKEQGSFLMNPILWMVVLLWIVMFWVRRRDSKKAADAREALNNSLVKGARVVTIGRIHGEVVDVDGTTFTIRPDKKHDFTLTFEREAFLRLESDPAADAGRR